MNITSFVSTFKSTFPNHPIELEGSAAVIPSPCKQIGKIEVHDEDGELTVYVGEFTHSHFGSYEESLTSEQAEAQVISEVIQFFHDTFSEQIEFYWNNYGYGGWRPVDTGPERSVTWSGKVLHSA